MNNTMSAIAKSSSANLTQSSEASDAEAISIAIEHAAHLLPSQGPITAFVHHNTLHAFEDLDFDAAVRKGAELFGCHPYLLESDYRKFVVSGRIRPEDLDAVLLDQLGDRADEMLGFLGTRFSLYRAILGHELHDGPSIDVRWVVGDTNALSTFRGDAAPGVKQRFLTITRRWVMQELRGIVSNSRSAPEWLDEELSDRFRKMFQLFDGGSLEQLAEKTWESLSLHLLWQVCEHGATQVEPNTPKFKFVRHRDWILELTGEDVDEQVHELLIAFCSAFLDQGFCDWPLASPDKGFYRTFLETYGQKFWLKPSWCRGLSNELNRLKRDNVSPGSSILESLRKLGVAKAQTADFIEQSLLALRGFTGMIWQLETRGDRVTRGVPEHSLMEFLAIRLLLEQHAIGNALNQIPSFDGSSSEFREWAAVEVLRRPNGNAARRLRCAYRIFELAQLLGWNPETLSRLSSDRWKKLINELDDFSGVDRRYIYHLAYERKYRIETLDAVRVHALRTKLATEAKQKTVPDFQMVSCIDEREESLRRNLEEVHPNCETFGAAGFFAIPMYYRGAADAHFTPLCPIVIQPNHYVREEVVYSLKEQEQQRRRIRRTIGTVTHRVHIGSRTFTGGWLGTASLGSLATFPLVLRILFPRLTARIRNAFGGFVKPPEVTRLTLERDPQFPPGSSKDQLGFTIEEMANTVRRLLEDIGCTSNFARLFFVCGHGSASLNNPHEAAHDCGACAGGRGGPNARAFAQMANDSRVRQIVAKRGLFIPETTVFVGCYHNTCDDSVTYFDLDQIPKTHQAEFEVVFDAIEEARKRDAHERCRRFESASLDLSFEEALKHVESRAEDLSQVRPEYGHATNALCFVGRRQWNRGMFLDRRAFLQSYDPAQDDEHFTILERILQAVIPVCAGINLEYYFSFVDPVGYGCGTKLPHNITSLVGVMNGAGSDLRPGLPWQMVEIHEPVRLLFVIESSATAMLRIIRQNDAIQKLCNGNWVQVALLDPDTGQVQLYRNRRFEPYQPETEKLEKATTSRAWYGGWRDHLPFASIGPYVATSENQSRGNDGN